MKNQIHSLTFTATAAAGLLLALANTPAAAQTPLILNAAVNGSANQITITGQNLQPAAGTSCRPRTRYVARDSAANAMLSLWCSASASATPKTIASAKVSPPESISSTFPRCWWRQFTIRSSRAYTLRPAIGNASNALTVRWLERGGHVYFQQQPPGSIAPF